MKKYGFTLSELLVTITVIGVIASLTIPNIVSNEQNKINATRLQTSVQSVEQALTNIVAMQNADSLFETTPWSNGRITNASSDSNKRHFANELTKYLSVISYDVGTNAPANFYSGKTVYGLDDNGGRKKANVIDQFNNCIVLNTTQGATIFIRAFDKSDTRATGGGDIISDNVAFSRQTSLNANPADIFIDVNGKEGPNTVGRDLFHFYVGAEGILYPFGGKDVANYEGDTGQDWSSSTYGSRCTDGSKGNNGWGCTGRLIDEGYKINY